MRKYFGFLYRGAVVSLGKLARRFPDRLKLDLKPNLDILRRMDYPPQEILLDINSELELYVRANSCKKEPETIQWIHSFFKEGQVYYDVGANVGAYSLVAAKFLHGKIKVYAFEPGFMNFNQLCKNVLINNCQDNIIPLQIACSDRSAIDTLHYNNLTSGGALHALGQPIDFKNDVFAPVFKQAVLAYRLDDLIQHFNLPAPNHMKIDVDGNEFKILKGAEKTLSNPLLESLLVELDECDDEPRQVTEFVENKGLHFQSKHRYTGGDGGATGFNYIFQRSHA